MKALVLIAEGFEEIEALTPVDLLRRAGITVFTAGIGNKIITGARNIQVVCDITDNEINIQKNDIDIIILPGGNPGYINLGKSNFVVSLINEFYKNGKKIAAICGAPTVLSKLGLLKDKAATCFPDLLDSLECKEKIRDKKVVIDGNIITSRSAGTAVDFSLAVIEELTDKSIAEKIKNQIYY